MLSRRLRAQIGACTPLGSVSFFCRRRQPKELAAPFKGSVLVSIIFVVKYKCPRFAMLNNGSSIVNDGSFNFLVFRKKIHVVYE